MKNKLNHKEEDLNKKHKSLYYLAKIAMEAIYKEIDEPLNEYDLVDLFYYIKIENDTRTKTNK